MKIKIIASILFVIISLLFRPGVAVCRTGENNYYRQGVNYYLDGDIKRALESLKKAYEEEPDNKDAASLYSEVLVIRAGEYFEENNYEEALNIIKKAKNLRPQDAEIEKIYNLIYSKLYPEKADIKAPKENKEVFSDLKQAQEEKKEERIRVIKKPPEKLTVKEKELLRPIIIGGAGAKNDSNALYYFIGSAALILIIFAGLALYFINKLVSSNRDTMQELSESSSEKVAKMEAELKKLHRIDEKKRVEQEKARKKEDRKNRIDREKIKNEYTELFKESVSSTTRAPQSRVEPKIEEELTPDKEKEIEIKGSFKRLERINYGNAMVLLKKFSKNKNPWIKLWAAELSAEIKPEDAVNILKGLVACDEYQVKKKAIKILKSFLESDKTTPAVNREIRTIIDSTRKAGWVV